MWSIVLDRSPAPARRFLRVSGFGLFSDAVPRSPPTPVESKRRKAAARRIRQKKKKAATENPVGAPPREAVKQNCALRENGAGGKVSENGGKSDVSPDSKDLGHPGESFDFDGVLCSTKIVETNSSVIVDGDGNVEVEQRVEPNDCRTMEEDEEERAKRACREIPVFVVLERCDELVPTAIEDRKRRSTSPKLANISAKRRSTNGSSQPSRVSFHDERELSPEIGIGTSTSLSVIGGSSPKGGMSLSVNSLFRRSFSRLTERSIIENHPARDSLRELTIEVPMLEYVALLPFVFPERVVDFPFLFNNWDVEIIEKIGEGSFSEVFSIRKFEGTDEDESFVFKIVPANGPGQPSFEELLPEVSMCLASHDLSDSEVNRAPTFMSMHGLHLAQGRYTDEMIQAHDQFRDSSPDDAEMDHPQERPADQYYLVFFVSYNGQDLEKVLPRLNPNEKSSLIMQIVFGLAAAEAAFDFEHRDLHLSNIVVSDTDQETLEFRLDGVPHFVASCNKVVSLIDYGMCRINIDDTMFTPFSNSILEGDCPHGEAYREQHALVKGDYGKPSPQTNGVWIKFLIAQLFKRRPISKRTMYSRAINQLWKECNAKALTARQCAAIAAQSFEDHIGS